jgi:hypothetical protein
MSDQPQRHGEMRLKDRYRFAEGWMSDAKQQHQEDRVFSGFFSGYVAFVVNSFQVAADCGRKFEKISDERLEIAAIEFAVKERSELIDDFIISAKGQEATGLLRQRKVPDGEQFQMIGSNNDLDLKSATLFLFDLWNPENIRAKNPTEIKNQAQYLSVVFRKIRNRLFHGEKLRDPKGTDADLLKCVNPILFGVVEALPIY